MVRELKRGTRSVDDWLSAEVIGAIAGEIEAAGGNEVFFVGRLSSGGVVVEAEVAARGTGGAVLAVDRVVRPGDLVIHNHPGGTLKASGHDLDAAAKLGADGVGFAIIDNNCSEIYVITEPLKVEEARPLELDQVRAFFEPGGSLSRVLDGYEQRDAQVEMALAAAGTFNDGRIVMVEAGTGVGKSLAYLVPAIMWATRNHRRVVVSTNTINLQEQLIGSDLPVLERAGLEFRAVLVKGRRNYPCLRKADEILGEPDFFAETEGEAAELKELAEWAVTTGEVSLSDLSPPPQERLWDQLATQADDCTRTRCPFFNDCHFYLARKGAARADILIANHHLLFTDLALRQALGGVSGSAVLPPYSHIILDEAQHIEEVATTHFGTEISSVGLQRQLARLQYRGRSGRGLLPLLLQRLIPLSEGNPQAGRALERLETEVRPALATASEAVPAHFGSLERAIQSLMAMQEDNRTLRLTEEVEMDAAWSEDGLQSCRALRSDLLLLTTGLERLLRDLEPLKEEYGEQLDSPFIDIAAVAGRLNTAISALARFVDQEEDGEVEMVRWVERGASRKNMPRLTLASAPVEVGPQLARAVFGVVEGALLSSATLAIRDNFDFISGRLGLDLLEGGRVVAEVLKSPFDHSSQVELLIPDDFPEPTEKGHERALADILEPAIIAAGGRTLVLVTSYGSMRRLNDMLSEPLARSGIRLRCQGEAPRNDLLESLRGDSREALIATDSFWEGIDVRGKALSLLVLTRLPFRVPSEPVLQARAEKLEREGGRAFTELLLPMAVLKFKQGMGRLIRHRDDRGIALVLDPRILRKSYGSTFLRSLGWGDREPVTREDALVRVEKWFSQKRVND